uniref:TIL domain-containing protein n=1 Tax=Parastrongyloides trichosuri TaxID=131310 RepID=A0A0N4ZK93_PARTI
MLSSYILINIIFSCFIIVALSTVPWYLPKEGDKEDSSNEESYEDRSDIQFTINHIPVSIDSIECEEKCTTTTDCSPGLSCFSATHENKGCCLRTLKPNETGCVIDDQCKRSCESTHCNFSQYPSKCLCDKGRHFLFNKCWKHCPSFAYPDPVMDSTGFSYCIVKESIRNALLYMRRYSRQLRKNYC